MLNIFGKFGYAYSFDEDNYTFLPEGKIVEVIAREPVEHKLLLLHKRENGFITLFCYDFKEKSSALRKFEIKAKDKGVTWIQNEDLCSNNAADILSKEKEYVDSKFKLNEQLDEGKIDLFKDFFKFHSSKEVTSKEVDLIIEKVGEAELVAYVSQYCYTDTFLYYFGMNDEASNFFKTIINFPESLSIFENIFEKHGDVRVLWQLIRKMLAATIYAEGMDNDMQQKICDDSCDITNISKHYQPCCDILRHLIATKRFVQQSNDMKENSEKICFDFPDILDEHIKMRELIQKNIERLKKYNGLSKVLRLLENFKPPKKAGNFRWRGGMVKHSGVFTKLCQF